MPRSAVTVVADRVLEISWWRARSHALVWYASAFTVVLLYVALGRGQFQVVHRAIMGVIAVALGYFVAVQAANVTRLSVRDGALHVEHGPLPWRKSMVVPVDQISKVGFDVHAGRLELRTHQGEDVALLDDLLPDSVRDEQIATLALEEEG